MSEKPPAPERAQRPHAPPPPHASAGLYRTLWPSDHGNTARQKYVVSGGLPPDLLAHEVQTLSTEALPYAQWMYTRDPGEIFVYGAPRTGKERAYLARVDSRTLEVHQRLTLPRIAYIGGALVHANGDVYLIHGRRLYRFRGGDLHQETVSELPAVNGSFTQYNGLLVGEDGKLITKGWALNRNDLPMIWRIFLTPLRAGATLGLLLGLALILIVGAPLWVAPLLGLVTPPALVLLILGRSGAALLPFWRGTRLGHLLVIDPETLEVTHRATPPERTAFGRMSMSPAEPSAASAPHAPPAEWLVIAGDEHILRWRYEGGALTYDPAWSERYRTWGDGTFPGTGPSIFQDTVYYTDNTFPIGLGPGYTLYRKPLGSDAPQTSVALATEAPGYMFFSTVIDPANDAVLVWDTEGARVESRALGDLSLRWAASLFNTDCLSVASDRGHVYATDHGQRLSLMTMLESAGRHPRHDDIQKDFVVLDAATGAEQLRIPLGQGSPVASMIVPGMNNDVFVAVRDRLFRVYVYGVPITDPSESQCSPRRP